MAETGAAAHTDGAASLNGASSDHERSSGSPVAEDTKARSRLGSDERGQIIPSQAIWSHAARIGGGLTPQHISDIIRDADAGDTRRLFDLANECRQQDSHLQAVLATHEESIAGLPWQVVPSAEKPRSKDKRAAKWVHDELRSNPGLQRLISDLAGSYYYAFAVVEIIWTKSGGRMVPAAFVPVAPRRFRFRRSDGKLVFSDDGAQEVDIVKDHPNKFIVCKPRVSGDVANREGLCRPLVWMSVMRRWSISDWLHTAEMSWKPWRIAKYNKDKAAGLDRTDIETIIRRMTTDFTAVIPDSTDIKIEWPAGSTTRGGTHAELCTALANEMSKAVLGQTETTQSSTSSGYAQAKVHDTVRRDLREARARQIAADLTRDLVGAMVRLNFGESVEIPRFEFITQDSIDLKSFSEAMGKLAVAGLKIPQQWVRDQAGIPEPKDGEATIGGPQDEETDPAESPEESPAEEDPEDEGTEDVDD